MKYCSIIVVHYSLVDDFGGTMAKKVSHSRSQLLKWTMESLERHTKYPAELIVLDNGGNPDDSNYLLDLVRKGVINIYVRYKNNMHWAYAFREGAKIATGDYLCFTCNDLVFRPKWLSSCVELLEKYPDRKLIATPLILGQREYSLGTLDGNRLNFRAGSNCRVMKRETYDKLMKFPLRETGDWEWYKGMIRAGYNIIAPPEDLAVHSSAKGGLNWRLKVKIQKELLNKEIVDFYGT